MTHRCLDCHSMGYCSPQCQRADGDQHQFECFGLKTQLFAVLDGSRLLVRMLAAALTWLRAVLVRHSSELRCVLCLPPSPNRLDVNNS